MKHKKKKYSKMTFESLRDLIVLKKILKNNILENLIVHQVHSFNKGTEYLRKHANVKQGLIDCRYEIVFL